MYLRRKTNLIRKCIRFHNVYVIQFQSSPFKFKQNNIVDIPTSDFYSIRIAKKKLIFFFLNFSGSLSPFGENHTPVETNIKLLFVNIVST